MSTEPETTEDAAQETPGAEAERGIPGDEAEETAGARGSGTGTEEEAGARGSGTGTDEGAGTRDSGAEGEGAGGVRAAEADVAHASDPGGADPAQVGGADPAHAADADGAGGGRSAEADGAGPAQAEESGPAQAEESGPAQAEEGGPAHASGVGEAGGTPSAETDGAEAARVSEAEAELAAQRLERERIERRKAEKKGPIEAGTKLSGKAADLLAAVRAVESGEKPVSAVFAEPETAVRRPAPEPVRRTQPVTPAVAAAPAAEAVDAVRRVLAEGGAPGALAPQVAAALGDGAEERLRADPWLLLRVGGVRPEQADGFARALLGAECGPDDERRLRAVTVWLLEQAALAGHTALEMTALTAALAQRGVPDPDAAVQSALAEGELLAFQDGLAEPAEPEEAPAGEEDEAAPEPVRVLVGLERYALAEESLADGLARLIDSAPKQDGSGADWERAAAAARGSTAELVRAVAGHGLVLHTGGEAARAEAAELLDAARELGLRAWAAVHSPLGRGRFAPQAQVATLAGLLSGAEGPGRDADGALDLDLLIVLDAPQLDVEAGASLVESLPDGARLVLSGDPAVLWSAGPGRVFADLLAARRVPQIASRRPDPGPLGELVSGIGIGELTQVDAPAKEVVIVPVRDAGEAVHRTVQLVADSVPRAIGVPAEETVVITPGHGGAAGTRVLNAALKERLNPGPGRFGGFDPGDRVAYSPAPGRTLPGRVVGADADGLRLSCAGEAVVVPRERVEQCVRHGWALTAHQAVGGRWPAVVVVLPGDAAQTLTRPWVYTAFGRAERHLSVVHGVEQALPRAVAEGLAKPRTTRLPDLLRPAADPAE
ncbi:helix-hairpin-helix domain-containing protein [Streptomyces sp.]|uniref:helix-hairpin-helix domain-containing protein n=1 Tax=Streptomyces sp. TaxID=1931 RepID=UPI002D4FB8E5|nr:helix-hairpin-helix domain-containing protein [Streptomyces sp.]HZF91410.1 helix-hairpin-helix domain-containing protein [Streptomyces sp.]